MWVTVIATAMAASICLSVVSLTSQLNKIRDARNQTTIEYSAQPRAAFTVLVTQNQRPWTVH